MIRHVVLSVRIGDERYEDLIGQIRADAEHELDEQPGKAWAVVAVEGHGRWVPAAWAAATVEPGPGGPVLRCSDNYERRGPGRLHGLYPIAYRHRHETVVAPSRLPGLTYLFAQPIGLHEADGWHRTGLTGTSRQPGIEPHQWWELRRGATAS